MEKCGEPEDEDARERLIANATGPGLKRQLAVRSQTDQPNHLSALELINQHQIREDMTVAISLPVGSELMVAKPDWQRLIDQKMPDY